MYIEEEFKVQVQLSIWFRRLQIVHIYANWISDR